MSAPRAHESRPAAALTGALTAVVALALWAAPVQAAMAPKKKATTISGVVWADADGDGVRDQGEALVQGAKVAITRKSGKAFKPSKTLTTSKKGAYSYTVRASGKFRVAVTLPAGFSTFSPANRGSDRLDSDLFDTGSSATLSVRRGGTSKRIDAGLRRAVAPTAPFTQTVPAAGPPETPPAPTTPTPGPTTPTPTTPAPSTTVPVGDIVWSDSDQDGRQDPGEPGLAGVHVKLLSSAGVPIAETTSATSGAFTFTATIGTVYRLRADLPAGAVFSPKNVGVSSSDSDISPTGAATSYSDLFTASASLAKLGIGISFPGTSQLGNRVFEDRDGNGLYSDPTDRAMSGITVNLWNESRSQIIATTTTSSAGLYALQAPRGATYVLQFVAASYYLVSPKDAGDDTLDSDIFETGANKYFTAPFAVGTAPNGTLDAGFITPATLGNRVWDDVDADGIQDPGEPGLAGVTVQLWNAAKSKVFSQTVSSSTGAYELKAPGAQNYRIRAVLPSAGTAFSPKDQGGAESDDSDINPTGVNLGFTDIIAVDISLISTTIYDIGIDQP